MCKHVALFVYLCVFLRMIMYLFCRSKMGRVTYNSYQLISDESVSTASCPPSITHNSRIGPPDLCDKDPTISTSEQSIDTEFVPSIRWPDLMAQIFLHGGALYGICLMPYASWWTILWSKYTYIY